MDEAPILGGGRVRKILSPYGVGGESVYTAQEDLKSINSYNMGEGKMLMGLVFPFLHSKTLLGFIVFCPWVTAYLPLFIFTANSLALVDTLLMSNYLPISLLTHLGIQCQGKRGDDRSGFFRLSRSTWGSGFLLPTLLGSIYGGR